MTISSIVKIAQKSFKVKYFPDDSEVLTKYDNYWLYATGTRKNQNQLNKKKTNTKPPNNKQKKTN